MPPENVEGKAAGDASKTAELRTDGPTLAEYVEHGYDASTYPPAGYAVRLATPSAAPAPTDEATAEQKPTVLKTSPHHRHRELGE